ncbi:MAG: hypothetical protein IJP92_10545, partial [Lachnospiraceae bacterium]|nr:hypothetical protein [Lachnospiraceae bacterium]
EIALIIDMNIPSNKQYIMYRKAMNHRGQRIINDSQCCELLKEALEITVPFRIVVQKSQSRFITRGEIMCLLGMLIMADKKSRDAEILADSLESYYLYGEQDVFLSPFQYGKEMILTMIASMKGNNRCYDESDMISEHIIKTSLGNRRLYQIATNLYGICWNEIQRSNNTLSKRKKTAICRNLRHCIAISDFCGRDSKARFYREKLQCHSENKII